MLKDMTQAPTDRPEMAPEDYSHLSRTGQGLVAAFRARLLDATRFIEPRSILEVGCGQGWFTRELAAAYPDAHIVGTDIREDACAYAGGLVPGVEFRVSDAHSLPFEADSFDLVVCSQVLEHVERPPEALAELFRVASRGVVVSVPHEPWFRLANLVRGKYPRTLGNHPDHIQHWGPSGFRRLMSDEAQSVDITRSFPWLIARALTDPPDDRARSS